MARSLHRSSTVLLTVSLFLALWPSSGQANVDVEACHLVTSSPSPPPRKVHHHSEPAAAAVVEFANMDAVKVVDRRTAAEAEEEDYVLCAVRTLQPELDFENLTAAVPFALEKATVLRIVCNDLLFFESVFTPGQLSAFSEVFDLSIQNCKVKVIGSEALLGLDHLKRLRINTGNSDWAARSLELSAGAFESVPALQSLDLGFNHMWSLPQRLLCDLEALTSLNLTHNLLSDIDDLGFVTPISDQRSALDQRSVRKSGIRSKPIVPTAAACLSELKTLDLSYNNLRRLGSRRLEALKRLEDLRLENNWLEELDDEALSGLGSLKGLNLSSNRLVALPGVLFQASKQLRSIDLRNNSLSALSPGLLAGLEWLVTLDLSRNALTSQWITVEAFRGLVRLVILNLSHNQLTHLTPMTFSDLYTLQVLDLGNNLISSIADSTFSPMSNLHSLNLGRNKLVAISSKTFNGLYVLHKLILDYNQLAAIEAGSMRNCTSLSDLGLVGNLLTEVPQALRGLQNLKTLDLGENRISALTNESFQGMSQLYGIRLVANQLEEVPKGVCEPISDLRVFNAAQNKIRRVAGGAFAACPELRVLRLDSNALDTLPTNLGPQLPKLLWLNVSQNQIPRADYSLLPPSLEWFDVSHNELESLSGAWNAGSGPTVGKGSHHANHQNAKLRVVDASHNRLSHLDLNGVPPALDRLVLSHNRLAKILPDTFSRSSHLRRVDLIGNQLEHIPLAALRFQQVPLSKPLPEVFLGGNPFLCDCDMEYLLRIPQLSATRQYPTVPDLDAIICRLSYARAQTHIPLPEMKPSNFLCPYSFHCFQTCQCCEFDACDCSMTCPPNCTCYHGDSWTANVVDCANSNLSTVPARIPMDSTVAFLDGNAMGTLKSHSFIGRKTLRSLFLNGSNIETISNKSFNGLQSLEHLHLEGNRLQRLHGYEFDHLNKLRELYLQDNLIETISNATFLMLKELEILRLDGNRLAMFTVWQLSLNPYLVEIGLGRNAWSCDCHYLHQLYSWVNDNSRKVIDLGHVRCTWNATRTLGPHLLDYNSTCGTSWALIQGGLDGFDLPAALPLLVGLGAVVALLLLSAVLVFACRQNIRIWLHNQFGLRLCSTSEKFSDSEEKAFDAYFVYSQKDEEFVSSRIADELEASENYRLCLHYRDLLSEGDLRGVMSSALESSRALVLVFSRNFLQGEWSSSEYRAAFSALLKSSAKSGKSVLVLLIEPIPEEEMTADLSAWLRNGSANRLVSLKWADKKFWSKFKYALPDPSGCHYHSNITSQTTTSSASSSGGQKYPDEPQGGLDPQGTLEGHHTKYWAPYQAPPSSFVALPPKYGGHGVLTTLTRNPSPNYGPPIGGSPTGDPVFNSEELDIPSFLFQPNAKSPVPFGNFAKTVLKSTSSSGTPGGESYLSLEGEHVYSTLDPPSPPIQLPNGFTYAPAGPHHWNSPHPPKTPLPNYTSPKVKGGLPLPRRKSKEGSMGAGQPGATVQTYLV